MKTHPHPSPFSTALGILFSGIVFCQLTHAQAPATPTTVPEPAVVAAPVVTPTPMPPPVPAPGASPSWAGLAGIANGSPWEKTSVWMNYSHSLETTWINTGKSRLNKMRAWADTEVAPLMMKTKTVFYPFSGPDFLYEDTVFPDAQNVLMAGLEPVGGTLPDLGKLTPGELQSYLNDLKISMDTCIRASFFRTKDMDVQFRNGLTPALLVFIGRQGYAVDNVEYVHLEKDGTMTVVPGSDKLNGRSSWYGVRITYHKAPDEKRTLIYFSSNIANDGLKAEPGFVELMKKMAPGVTYLKAASYLLHDDYFSVMRDAILDNSVGVVEDDSGIPFKYFKPEIWTVKPYGNYTGPISLFNGRDQKDLHAFYKSQTVPPLDFGSGYRWQIGTSSLLVAIKK